MGKAKRRMEETATPISPVVRDSEAELHRKIEIASNNPIINGILGTVQGLLAVLNENRQILAVNESLLTALGVGEGEQLLGLRPGEAVRCVHAHEEAEGCGTSKICSTCGAAIAMAVSLAADGPVERECAISAQRDGKPIDFYFQVRCCPIEVEGQRFLLLFLRDVGAEQQRGALERVFYHDVSNLLECLLANSRSLSKRHADSEQRELAGQIQEIASRLAAEVRIQKVLSRGPDQYNFSIRDVPLERSVRNLEEFIRNHHAAKGKKFRVTPAPPELRLCTDPHLLERVLMNMLINAFEATPEGGEVRLWVEDEEETVAFHIWNRQAIPTETAQRVFQRNFTTKDGTGRGLGTFAMRLLGETYLGGRVSFTTSPAEGTVFRFALPKRTVPGRLPD